MSNFYDLIGDTWSPLAKPQSPVLQPNWQQPLHIAQITTSFPDSPNDNTPSWWPNYQYPILITCLTTPHMWIPTQQFLIHNIQIPVLTQRVILNPNYSKDQYLILTTQSTMTNLDCPKSISSAQPTTPIPIRWQRKKQNIYYRLRFSTHLSSTQRF